MSSGSTVSTTWVEWSSGRHGLSLAHPPSWELSQGAAGLLVSVVDRQPPAGFRTNANVVRRVRDTTLDLDGLTQAALATLMRVLNEPIVVDVDTDAIAGSPARRSLIAYRQGLDALSTEQWLWADDEHIWTFSGSALAESWDAAADILDRIARSITLETS